MQCRMRLTKDCAGVLSWTDITLTLGAIDPSRSIMCLPVHHLTEASPKNPSTSVWGNQCLVGE